MPTENGKKVLAMAEYINRERARFEAEHYFKGLDNIQEDLDMLFCMLPAEDVAPVRHGSWEEADWIEYSANDLYIRTPRGARRCSECKRCFKKEGKQALE